MINETIDKKFVSRVTEIIKASPDTHKIHTSLALCREMINSVFDKMKIKPNNKYLCLINLEFLYVLKQKIGTLDNVYFATPDLEFKGKVAISLGIKPENILLCKYGTATIDTEMKFDVVIANPPYNPNSIWKKFVELQISLLNDDGKMVTIHPSAWREHSKHNQLFKELNQGIEELHICDYEAFKENKVAVKTDWYLYSKNYTGQQKVLYSNGDTETLDLRSIDKILRFCSNSHAWSIMIKLLSKIDNGIILMGNTGYHPLYKKHVETGKYKQCGGEGNGKGWIKNKFLLTDEPSEHQFEDKVVMAYANQPAARYFSKTEEIGVVRAHYWLTNNQSLPLLLNSKMLWKIITKIVDPDKGQYKPYGVLPQIPGWILKSINFDGLTATTEEELYQHYKLTQEEINWINE